MTSRRLAKISLALAIVLLIGSVIGSVSRGGLPVPQLGLKIDPPPGVAEPTVTETYGSSTSVNNDAHRRVWLVQVPAEGDYQITTEGQVNGFISPQLSFGHGGNSSSGSLVWVFVGLFVVGLIGTIAAPIWLARTRIAPLPVSQPMAAPSQSPVMTPSPTQLPTDEGVRIEQLKTLTALRGSGALTQKEFEDEKRRILDGR